MYRKILIVLLLFLNWLLFSGKYDCFHMSIGLLASILITYMSGDLVFEFKNRTARDYMYSTLKLPVFLVWLLWNIMKSNFYVLYLSFHPNLKKMISPRILQIKTDDIKDEFSRFIFAQSVTLTPGTVTVLADEDIFTIHAISEKAAESLPEPLEGKVKATFEPKGKRND